LLEAADERCVVEIAAASRDTVVDRFHELVYEEEFEDRSTIPLTLVAADFQYGTSGSDLEILGRMAGFGQSLSVLWLAQAAASAFGIKTLYHLGALPAVAERFAEPGYARFTAYKQDPAARWVSLVVNRFLGRERHENETLGYAEAEHAGHPEWRPWANGIWLAAAAYARSLSRHGHAGDLDGLNASGDFEGLPTFPYPTAMNRTEPYGTETMIEDVKSLELVHSGFTPLVGEKGAGRGYFPMVANTYRPEGAVLLDASAAHQLLLGDLVHTLLRRLPETPSGSPDERAAWVRGLVETWAGGFEGERDAEDLTVTAQSEDGNDFVSVFLRLPIRLHNHRPEFTLDLPLGA
jgi:predicted component of type VI protein secretion system